VFEFVVLVKTALRTVGLSTGLNSTAIVAFNFISIPPHTFALLVLTITLTGKLVVLVLAESLGELMLFLDEFLHLRGEGDVGEVQAAVFMIVSIFLI
jgi:hypothetical protein